MRTAPLARVPGTRAYTFHTFSHGPERSQHRRQPQRDARTPISSAIAQKERNARARANRRGGGGRTPDGRGANERGTAEQTITRTSRAHIVRSLRACVCVFYVYDDAGGFLNCEFARTRIDCVASAERRAKITAGPQGPRPCSAHTHTHTRKHKLTHTHSLTCLACCMGANGCVSTVRSNVRNFVLQSGRFGSMHVHARLAVYECVCVCEYVLALPLFALVFGLPGTR